METNKIYKGDAYELIKQIPDKSIDLIITDPPYQIDGLQSKPHGIMKRKGGNKHEKELLENGLDKGIDLKILNDFVRVLKKINIYIWCNKEQIYDYLTYFVKERNCNWEMIIWAKNNPLPFLGGHYLKDKEYCLYFWETGVKVNTTYLTGKTIYISSINITDKEKYYHPTIKPIDIIENLIKNSAVGGANTIILDPFIGSGTTCLAAKRLGYEYIGFEINDKYYNIAVDRLSGVDQNGNIDLFDADYEQMKLF